MVDACCVRNGRQLGDGLRLLGRCMYLATVLAETLNPSLANSAWILRCPHNRFSLAMRRMRACTSCAIGRRPASLPRLERLRQQAFQPRRCQRSTVAAFTTRMSRQLGNHRLAKIQKRRSLSLSRGRNCRRRRTSSCCRGHKLSANQRRPRPTTDPDSPSPPREHCPLRSSSRKAEAGRHTSSSRT